MYTTLQRVRIEKQVGPTQTGDDQYITDAIEEIAGRIDTYTKLTFAPQILTLHFDALSMDIDDQYNTLFLNYPLLEATSVVDGQGNTLTHGTDWDYYPLNATPYFYIRLKMAPHAYGWSVYSFPGDWQQSIHVTGTWGYRSGYPANGWFSSRDKVITTALDTDDVEVTVGDADGTDGQARAPRFSPGNLIKIAGALSTSEICYVRTVDTTNNKLGIVRAQRGTTAINHAINSVIDVWSVEPDIVRAATRWVSYMHSRKGNFQSVEIEGAQTVIFPDDLPSEVSNILAFFSNNNPRAV